MFCPRCKCEYREGFTICADCDVALVAELSVESSPINCQKHEIPLYPLLKKGKSPQGALWKIQASNRGHLLMSNILLAGAYVTPTLSCPLRGADMLLINRANNPLIAAGFLLRGMKLLTNPKLRLFILIPILINIVLYSAALALGYYYVDTLIAQFIPPRCSG